MRNFGKVVAIIAINDVGLTVLVSLKQVESSIFVVVEPYSAHGIARAVDAHLFGDLGKVVAVIAVEPALLFAEGNEQIGSPVIVEVNECGLASLTPVIHSHLCDHIRKVAMAVATVESVRRAGVECKAYVEIEVTISVEISPRCRTDLIRIRDARFNGDIDEVPVVIVKELDHAT